MKRDAVISACGVYRYSLSRSWDEALPEICFVLLNPSTADATQDDPTLRRGIGFAKDWGYGSLRFVNLFAYRATQVKDMKAAEYPVGPVNDLAIVTAAKASELVVLAWGNDGAFQGRDKAVINLLIDNGHGHKLRHFGLTKPRQPRHPLYLKATTPLLEWAV